MKKVDFKNEERKLILAYLLAKQAKADAEKAEKESKKSLKALFTNMGKEYKETAKSTYLYGTLRNLGKVIVVVYRETIRKGNIDWQAYALSLGGTLEGAEKFRKPDIVTASFDEATEAQLKEILENEG